jgi:HEAT repeat protein
VVIKASAGREIGPLISDLSSTQPTTRDAAIARLTVLGARAVARLLEVARDPGQSSQARTGALSVLDQIADPRSFPPALELVDDGDDRVAEAAIALLSGFLHGPHGIAALDRLTAVALATHRQAGIRLAAARAISQLNASTIAPILRTLAADADAVVASGVRPDRVISDDVSGELLDKASQGDLPDDPAMLRHALARRGGEVAVTGLHQMLEAVLEREAQASEVRRGEWMALRAAIHVVLSLRGSRLGLYDLRDTLAAAKAPVAVEFLSAASNVGDAGCLEALAAAYDAASASPRPDEWWRRHLIDAFRAIVRREGLTRRHAAVRRTWTRFPAATAALWP